jgi:hypothetical protein
MNRPKRLIGIALFILLVVSAPSQPKSSDKPSIKTLSWLAGDWSLEKNGRVVTEIWMPPAGGTMLGMSRTVANEKTVEYEFIVLRQDANGEIFYVAKPSGQPEASFKLTRGTATEAVFENPEHDFPQRISYKLNPDGTLLAAIEGTKAEKTRRVEFPYKREVK